MELLMMGIVIFGNVCWTCADKAKKKAMVAIPAKSVTPTFSPRGEGGPKGGAKPIHTPPGQKCAMEKRRCCSQNKRREQKIIEKLRSWRRSKPTKSPVKDETLSAVELAGEVDELPNGEDNINVTSDTQSHQTGNDFDEIFGQQNLRYKQQNAKLPRRPCVSISVGTAREHSPLDVNSTQRSSESGTESEPHYKDLCHTGHEKETESSRYTIG